MPLVSVVLPTYNRAPTLGRAIESVLAQTCENLELIVIDDGSTDDTSDVIAHYQADRRVRHIRLPGRGGAAAARNAGIREGTSPFVAFQDSDDVWMPRPRALAMSRLWIGGGVVSRVQPPLPGYPRPAPAWRPRRGLARGGVPAGAA